ncbi:MAG: hypothetical protein E2O54_05235 [Gammaproteobacteria bacterium]|nr:MAG: hypothetical protein E2O54_05235 [Gammaproteobacteria bacterium]
MTISRMHVIGVALLLGGCSGAPLDLSLDEQVAERRAVQTRSFAGRDRIEVIIAASGALRDLGFIVEEIDDELGLVSAVTERNISEPGNQLLQFGLLLLTGQLMAMPEREELWVSMLISESPQRDVYITCERKIWNDDGLLVVESSGRVEQAEFYQRLFDSMSTALFVEDEL